MNKKTTPNRYRPQPEASALTGVNFMQTLDLCIKVILIIVTISISTLFFIFVENLVTQSSFFAIREITITGAQEIPREEILKAADVALYDNILYKKLYHIHKRLISHPWIRDAAVKRKIPSTLTISIREEIPMAVMKLSDDVHILINIQGEAFAEYPRDVPGTIPDLPVVAGIHLSRVNDSCSFSGPTYNALLDILQIKTREKIGRITADDQIGLELEASQRIDNNPDQEPDTISLKMGFSEYPAKFKTIRLINTYVKENHANQRISSMDLINLDTVVVVLHDRDSV